MLSNITSFFSDFFTSSPDTDFDSDVAFFTPIIVYNDWKMQITNHLTAFICNKDKDILISLDAALQQTWENAQSWKSVNSDFILLNIDSVKTEFENQLNAPDFKDFEPITSPDFIYYLSC